MILPILKASSVTNSLLHINTHYIALRSRRANLHSDDGINEEQHDNEQKNVRQCLQIHKHTHHFSTSLRHATVRHSSSSSSRDCMFA